MYTARWSAAWTVLTLIAAPAALRSQGADKSHTDSATARIDAVKRQRQGAGLRVGTWQTTGLTEVAGASYTTLPAFEGYWQKGLDKHLAIETTGGFWGRTQRDSNGRVSSFAIPMLTAIKLYPATTVDDQLEPFLSAGGGFTIGVDDESGATGGLFSGGSSGTALIIGLGLKGGAGIEYHASRTFGLQAGIAYQWIHFLNPVGGNQDYKGPLIFGGLSYRFQY
jgi:hypothetical protein